MKTPLIIIGTIIALLLCIMTTQKFLYMKISDLNRCAEILEKAAKMKQAIEVNILSVEKRFIDVEIGEFFIYQGTTLIRTNNPQDAVALTKDNTGILVHISDETMVKQVDSLTLTIHQDFK